MLGENQEGQSQRASRKNVRLSSGGCGQKTSDQKKGNRGCPLRLIDSRKKDGTSTETQAGPWMTGDGEQGVSEVPSLGAMRGGSGQNHLKEEKGGQGEVAITRTDVQV